MSTQLSNSPAGKRSANIYSVMLLLAMLFMLIAVIAMWVELGRWAPDYYKTNTARPTTTSMVAPAANAQFA